MRVVSNDIKSRAVSTVPFTTKICNFANYYPFGMQHTGTAGSYDLSSDYRYGYGGHEKDDEIKGEANSLDYGARIYDPRVGRWMSIDPLANKPDNIGWSPYAYCWNNPINVIDPDGRSGEPVMDKKSKTITVHQHLVFFGGKANSELSGKIATGIASQWNGARGTVKIDGVTYKVKFRVTYETVSTADATKMAKNNTDIKNNFIQVDDLGNKSSAFQLGGNAGYFNTRDDIGGSTTPAHEIGHGLGLDHTSSGGQTKDDVPDIMEARRTTVHPRWSKEGPSNEIDPNFRRVDKKEVEAIFKGVTFDKNGKGKIGTTTNTIYNKKKDE